MASSTVVATGSTFLFLLVEVATRDSFSISLSERWDLICLAYDLMFSSLLQCLHFLYFWGFTGSTWFFLLVLWLLFFSMLQTSLFCSMLPTSSFCSSMLPTSSFCSIVRISSFCSMLRISSFCSMVPTSSGCSMLIKFSVCSMVWTNCVFCRAAVIIG